MLQSGLGLGQGGLCSLQGGGLHGFLGVFVQIDDTTSPAITPTAKASKFFIGDSPFLKSLLYDMLFLTFWFT